MKALVCTESGDISNLKFLDVQRPQVGSDEVLIRARYCGVNFPDILITEGKYQFRPELPFVPGGEVSGEIHDVGEDVKGFEKGDLVIAAMGWGGFAEYAVAKANNTFKLISEDFLKSGSALLETYGTAIHALRDRGTLKTGEKLVVLGAAGGTGTAAVQLGKIMGAEVIAVAGSDDKLSFARARGADRLINYRSEDLKGVLKEHGGIDVVFDPVGGEASEQAFRALNPSGRHLVVGFASGKIPALPWNLPLLKSASIVGVFWGHFWRHYPEKNRRNIDQLLKWMQEGKLIPHVTEEFELADGVSALKHIKERKVIGKVVLKV